MTTIILSVVIFTLVVIAMAIGVIFSNKPIKGSCGGLANLTGESCQFCGKKPNEQCSDKS